VGALLIFPASPDNPLPTSPCTQGEGPKLALPPLHRRGGLGWGPLLIFPASPSNPLPTSPSKQGEGPKLALPPLLAGEGWGGVRF
jgi:hypothetical protein